MSEARLSQTFQRVTLPRSRVGFPFSTGCLRLVSVAGSTSGLRHFEVTETIAGTGEHRSPTNRTGCNVMRSLMRSLCVGLTALAVSQPLMRAGADDASPSQPNVAAETITPTSTTPDALELALADLSAPDFARRQQAIDAMRSLSAEQLTAVGSKIESSPNSDVVRQVIEVVARHYTLANRKAKVVGVASELLESAAESPRWFVAESARDTLTRHGQRRVSLAIDELVSMKANLRPRTPERLWAASNEADAFAFRSRNTTRDNILKIFIDRSWPPGPRARALLKRLEPLVGSNFLRSQGSLAIILADGHPLSQEEVAQLRGMFGDTQVQERGKVSLGVQKDPLMDGEGVFVEFVQKGSSADNAGIRPGDVITMIDGKRLPDFDTLVTELRKYEVGDQARLTVRRGLNGIESSEPEEITVTLLAWDAIPDEPAEDTPPAP